MSNFFKTTAGKITIVAIVAVCIVAVFLAKHAVDTGTAEAEAAKQEQIEAGLVEPDESLPMFVEFGADWCAYCKKMQPVMEEIKEEYSGKINFEYIDIDENPEIAQSFGVSGVPHFALLDAEGEPQLALSGATTKEKLQQFISEGVGIEP